MNSQRFLKVGLLIALFIGMTTMSGCGWVNTCIERGRALEQESRNQGGVNPLWRIYLADANGDNIGTSIECNGSKLIAFIKYQGPHNTNMSLKKMRYSTNNGATWRSGSYDKKRKAWKIEIGRPTSMDKGSSELIIKASIYDANYRITSKGKQVKDGGDWGQTVYSPCFHLEWR